MTKTNKSFLKRVKITPTGKILARIPGQNHFNAKERRIKQLHQKGWQHFPLKKKVIKRYLPHAPF